MMLTALMLSVMFAVGDDGLAPRVQTLAGHVERLAAITVPPALESEKQMRLADLRAAAARREGRNCLRRALFGHR